MTNYKAYIRNLQMEEKQIKINLGIYDSDLPVTTKIKDINGIEETIPRPEETAYLFVPYNVPDDYIRNKIKEFLEEYKIKNSDFLAKSALKNEIFG